LALIAASGGWLSSAAAATLPSHTALRILVIGDEVNPNGLTVAELTQPLDIAEALQAPDSGLLLNGDVALVDSQCIDAALSALESATPPDVVVYFAHRAALGCQGAAEQESLTALLEARLQSGGGMVVFHHGLYTAVGKEAILQLIGAQSGSIAWDTTSGQRVFNVEPGHFVTSNGVEYPARAAFAGSAEVEAAEYDYFDNLPDERYPSTQLLVSEDETRTILFASDSGGTRVLGYSVVRPGWAGRVVAYQPGEYQPAALDQREGNNFQILANAIVFASGQVDAEGQPPAMSEPEPVVGEPEPATSEPESAVSEPEPDSSSSTASEASSATEATEPVVSEPEPEPVSNDPNPDPVSSAQSETVSGMSEAEGGAGSLPQEPDTPAEPEASSSETSDESAAAATESEADSAAEEDVGGSDCDCHTPRSDGGVRSGLLLALAVAGAGFRRVVGGRRGKRRHAETPSGD
jgi:hypothetical protein